MEFLIVNGTVAGKDEIYLNHILTETSFRLSQKVWYGYGGIPFLAENMEQIKSQVDALKLPFPKEFENRRELQRLIKRMLNKNKFYRSGYVHLQVFWIENQVYTIISANTFHEFDFPFTETGLLVTFSSLIKSSQNAFNRFPFFNELLWQAGLTEIRHSSFQQIIFLNENNSVCESANANIYLMKGNELLTPALSTGCCENVLRSFILEAAGKMELDISEKKQVTVDDILGADELFIASETSGIQWILGMENKRFLHYFSKKIHEALIEKLKPK